VNSIVHLRFVIPSEARHGENNTKLPAPAGPGRANIRACTIEAVADSFGRSVIIPTKA
jgi:hypothetical protein